MDFFGTELWEKATYETRFEWAYLEKLLNSSFFKTEGIKRVTVPKPVTQKCVYCSQDAKFKCSKTKWQFCGFGCADKLVGARQLMKY